MWFADIYCDLAWVRERKGELGPAQFVSRGRSQSIGIGVDFLLYGDEITIRHARVLLHTEDQQIAEACTDMNIQSWVASLEVAAIMVLNQPFRVLTLPNSHMFAICFGQGDERSPSALLEFQPPNQVPLSYRDVGLAMSVWGPDLSEYLFYFRRLVDSSLPLDVRWLNGYRLLEWHFVRDQAGLAKNTEWKLFVQRFDADLLPLCRPSQRPVGLLEEARAMAAHAGTDNRSDAERFAQPQNPMRRTFRVYPAGESRRGT